MKKTLLRITALACLAPLLAGCASLGHTPAEKRQAILKMRDDTLARLYREKPGAKTEIANAAGYGVFDAASQNIILVQTGGGYGVLTDRDGSTTYMKVGGAGVGFGIGLKDYHEVIIFRGAGDFRRFRDKGWDASGQAEAAAKGGSKGGAVAGKQSVDLNVITYELLDSGIALQATVGATKYWQWDELNQ